MNVNFGFRKLFDESKKIGRMQEWKDWWMNG